MSAEQLTPVTLELGGKNPVIVMPSTKYRWQKKKTKTVGISINTETAIKIPHSLGWLLLNTESPNASVNFDSEVR